MIRNESFPILSEKYVYSNNLLLDRDVLTGEGGVSLWRLLYGGCGHDDGLRPHRVDGGKEALDLVARQLQRSRVPGRQNLTRRQPYLALVSVHLAVCAKQK